MLCSKPLQVHAISSSCMLHSKIELIRIFLLCLSPQVVQGLLLSLKIISASLIVFLPFKNAELAAALPALATCEILLL